MKKLVLMLMLLAPMTMMAQKFGKVNTQTIMQALPDVAKANGELEALQKQKDNELKAMQEEFQRKADEYQKGASTMNATAKQQKETELQGLQQKIQQAYQDGQQELQKKSNELMQPIVAKVRAAIDAVGKAGNYTYIFEEGAAIYTGSNVLDVTKEVQSKIK
ncbi:MAG: OmpH family outer membrane protein [Prevotella sp.]|jgi:outer membrane protein|uniref:OmpH family outer membrane protein n=1 Tax=Segatella intestinalis TaxID=3035284 RepID=UPI0003368D61|nr:OmpH family outer membrane protein [Prevotella sp. B2-R-102]MBD9073310.1 OmpH family outer membrane protein [Prevotella sp.]MBD9260247.1 OmpH family outer membrane protein [Prevotella sp.]MDF4240384.1 OmpH family outer membrane protein [Prevotella sp. B2-R-102]CDC24555.1 cationic outer membrane protein OmpH [Prevotella sp. CAG:386]